MNEKAGFLWVFSVFTVFFLIIFFELFFVQTIFLRSRENSNNFFFLNLNALATKKLFSGLDENGLSEKDLLQKRILFNVVKRIPVQKHKENCFYVERIVLFQGKLTKVFFEGCK